MKVISTCQKIHSNLCAISVYQKLRTEFKENQLFLLESLAVNSKNRQKSIIGFNPIFTFKVINSKVIISGNKEICSLINSTLSSTEYLSEVSQNSYILLDMRKIFDLLRLIESSFKIKYQCYSNKSNIGFFGYFAYDSARFLEDLPYLIKDNLNLPEINLSIYQGIYYFDLNTQETYLTINNFSDIIFDKVYTHLSIQNLIDHAAILEPDIYGLTNIEPTSITDSMTKEKYLTQVLSALKYISNGDIYQIQLGHSISIHSKIDPFIVYLRKRQLNPSPYMYYTQMEDLTIIGASPELLVKLNNNNITIRPIAGTIKRGESFEEDAQLKQKLSNDPKEKSEHLMLVDLSRNDIGRVCKTGSLTVTELMQIEEYSHVLHMVSNISGELDNNIDKYSVFSAVFPAGTLTGTPKIRAMEIIEILENTRRSLYGGSIGFFDFNGNMETALCIRTSFYQNGIYQIRASAGIVTDSIPANEWIETLNKLSASYKAITGKELNDADFIN